MGMSKPGMEAKVLVEIDYANIPRANVNQTGLPG
jgi:hypothetical protein